MIDKILTRLAGHQKSITAYEDKYHRPYSGDTLAHYVEDVGYLLGLLEMHQADELPDNMRNVQAYSEKYRCWVTAFYQNGVWYTNPGLFSPGNILEWRELPSVLEVTK